MEVASILAFAVALLIAAATPGPGIAALVARVLARGREGAVAFSVGLALGDLVWLAAAVAGLSVLAQSFAGVFLTIRYAGALYLAFLAYKFWTAPPLAVGAGRPAGDEQPLRLFLAGLAVTLGNPKVMVFYLALVPSFIDVTRLGLIGFAELSAVVLAVLALVFGSYIGLASRARRLLSSPRALRWVQRGAGAAMAGAAAAVATR